nr:uncharacterized protein LOC111425103 [Onthophagus taurus]
MSDIHQLCRLCLSNENLVDVFDEQLTNAYKLRLCVVLCTGIEIEATDQVSKLICNSCSSLVIDLYKFRRAAVANDKSLKKLINQDSDTTSFCKESIQNLNESIYERLIEDSLSSSIIENPKPILIDVATETDPIENNCEKVRTLKIRIPKHILTQTTESGPSSDNELEEDNNEDSENQIRLESDDDDTPIATLKRKYRSVRAHKMFESRFLSESESDSEPISKRNKSNKYYIDDDYSGNDTDNEEDVQEFEEEEEEEKEQENTSDWKRIRPQRRKNQTQDEIEAIPDKLVEKQSVDQKYNNEPYSKYCAFCDRYFWGNSQLKAHQRVHFRCGFCTKGFESHEVLQEHLVNVCYNNIINQKLSVSVVRVDDDVELIRTYQSAFDKYFQDIASGVYNNPKLINKLLVKHHLSHNGTITKVEKYEIRKIFIKFSHIDNSPVYKNLSVQTKRLQTDTSHPQLNNIVLDDAYTDLKLFDIPIHFVTDKLQSAYVSFAKPAKDKKVRDLWTAMNVIDIFDKNRRFRNHLPTKILPQNNLQNNILTSMLPPMVPLNTGVRKSLYRVMPADGLQPQIRPNYPVHSFGNMHDSARVGPNVLRQPFRQPQKAIGPSGPNQNVPNLKIKYIATHAPSAPKNNIHTTNTKINSEETDSQKHTTSPIILNVLLNEKSKNSRNISEQQGNESESNNPRCYIRRTYNRKPTKPNPIESANISKAVCDNFKLHVLKQNKDPNNQTESITPEAHMKQSGPIQNNLDISYPPRPNTAIRNMLQNISSEISIEPNYRKQNQTNTNQLKSFNNESTDNTPKPTNNLSKPTTMTNKPKAYPRPIIVKEELQPEEEEYITSDQALSSNEDFSTGVEVKDEQELEDHNYSQMGVTEDPIYNTSNVYTNTVQPNLSYSEQHPLQYHSLPQQYYKPMSQATNQPAVRNRFPTTQPYRQVQYRGRAQMPMYHPRLNQPVPNIINPPIPSNTLVPGNSFTNNFLPNNMYHRPYNNNYNNYNMYQPSYQNQYSSYNSQTQPAMDFNSPYQPEPISQDTESKLHVKQPWEMFR